MRTLLYVVLSILTALATTFVYGFLLGILGLRFPGFRNVAGGAIVFWSALAVALIYSRSLLKRRARAQATDAREER